MSVLELARSLRWLEHGADDTEVSGVADMDLAVFWRVETMVEAWGSDQVRKGCRA